MVDNRLVVSSNGYGVKAFRSPQDQLRKFASNVKPINVPLFHFKDPDVRALELVIQYGLSKGINFVGLIAKNIRFEADI